MQEVIDGIKKENNIADDAELQRQLRREGMSLDDLKRNIERSIVRRQVLTRELEAKATVNEAEARAEYERNKDAHTRRASVHLHEIVVADEEQARALVARARAGEDFAALARAHSTAASRDAGGDLGVLHRGEMNAAVEAVAFALPEGGVSDPLPTEGGYRIIRATREEGRIGGVVRRGQGRDHQAPLPGARHQAPTTPTWRGSARPRSTQTMVTEVPLQLSLPAAGTGTMLPPSAAGTTAAPRTRTRSSSPRRRPVPSASRPPARRRPRPRARPRRRRRSRPLAERGPAGLLRPRVRGGARHPARPRRDLRTGRGDARRAAGRARRGLGPARAVRRRPSRRCPGTAWWARAAASPRARAPGPELQRKRLRAEGVTFRGAAVDMRRHGVGAGYASRPRRG